MEPLQHNATGGLLFARLSEWREQVEDWCAGRSWLVRAPLLLWLAYVAARHVADPLYTSLFGPLNLAPHEGGHLLFVELGGASGAPPRPPARSAGMNPAPLAVLASASLAS